MSSPARRVSPADGAGQSDGRLLERVSRRDPEAFTVLVERYQARFFRVALRILGNESDAEDGVQLAFLRVFRKAGEYRSDWEGSTWLYRVLTNVCVDVWRKRRRESARGDEADVDAVAAGARSIAARLDLEAALARLSPEARLVFVLRYSEELSYDEIARVRGVSVNTVKTQLSRARRTMRAWLKGEDR